MLCHVRLFMRSAAKVAVNFKNISGNSTFSPVCPRLDEIFAIPESSTLISEVAVNIRNLSGSSTISPVCQRLDEILAIPLSSTLISEKKTESLCEYYTGLIPCDRTEFIRSLASDYGVDSAHVQQYASLLAAASNRGPAALMRAEERLRHALVPKYQHLFTHISKLERGVKFLVDLRAETINQLSTPSAHSGSFHAMNQCLRDLLSLWFSVGFLSLERITWQSSCDMLQKISEYEAVHPIRNWTDLKRRVGDNRRCFVFTHHSMPREPVVVLHTALTNEISHSIQSIVNNETCDSTAIDKTNKPCYNTAIFYSITSTQKGLQGVEMGNHLIKNVVRELVTEFPHIYQFSSLSPIPGFKDWLLMEINKFLHQEGAGEFPQQTLFTKSELKELQEYFKDNVIEGFKKSLTTNAWFRNRALVSALEKPLMRLCARYLYLEKRRGFTLNPVANFHLRNGAVMWRLNWLADVSPRGLGASCGLMVNYRYFLDQTETNSKIYMEENVITASTQVMDLVKDLESPAFTTHSNK